MNAEVVPPFEAFPAGDGVLVRATEEYADSIVQVVDQWLRLRENGEVPRSLRRRHGRGGAEVVLRRMFRSTASVEFWAAHREALTDPGPARRVRERCSTPSPWVVPFAELEDWFVTFAQLRALYELFPEADLVTAQAYSNVPERLALAVEPSAAHGWPTV